jgi:hypothetical protein
MVEVGSSLQITEDKIVIEVVMMCLRDGELYHTSPILLCSPVSHHHYY